MVGDIIPERWATSSGISMDGYLKLKNRDALEEMRAHRQRLRKQLDERPPGGIDAGPAMEALDEDLRVIEAAIDRH
jgi:hypothetical protein